MDSIRLPTLGLFFVYLWLFHRKNDDLSQIKRPKESLWLGTFAWVLLMFLNNLLLSYGYSVLFRQALEIIIPVGACLYARDEMASIGLRTAWSKVDILWLIPSGIVFTAWILSGPTPSFKNILLVGFFFIFVGFSQEVFYRGFLQPRAEAVFGPNLGIIFTSILFAVYHPISKMVTQGFHHSTLVFLLIFGLMMGFSFRWSRNVWPLAIFHWVFDIAIMVK